MKNSGIRARKAIVKNQLGMHARPASKIARIAGDAKSGVWLCADSARVDASSVIDILTLSAVQGTTVSVEIENEADLEILDQIVAFFEHGFGEA